MIILPGNVATALGGGYEVANSLRFDTASSTDLVYTPSSTGSRRTFTWSVWIKRSKLGAGQQIFTKKEGSGSDNNGNGNADYLALTYFNSDDTLTVARNQEGDYINVSVANKKFRDIGAWYHVVASIDTTQGTGSNRVKCWVNGEAQSLTFTTTPTENRDLDFNQSGEAHHLGSYGDGSSAYFSGYLAECVLMDGTAVSDATNFGEYDEDSPTIWKPKDVSGLSLGTNGFYLDFENSSSLGNDAAGSNNFGTVNNLAATDQCSDSPTNNFATMNPLYHPPSNPPTLSEGNCKVVSNSTSFLGGIGSTIGVASSKWYVEVKVTTRNTGAQIGVTSDPSEDARNNRAIGYLATSFGYQEDGQEVTNDTRGTYGATYDTDIIGIALDCDNNKIYYSKNGGWSDGDGTSDASTPNDYQTITAPASTPTGFYFFGASDGSSSATNTYEFNFGNPTFAISSGNSDANGYGNFEYAVPSGYLALCTKNLGSDGG